ncbi:MAG: hypothetical protein WCD42_14140, partial [Rhizomicrobium sp.]
RLLSVLGGALLVAGCASSSEPVSLSDGLHALVGQKADAAVTRLGAPPSIHHTKDGIQYVWTARAPSSAPGGKHAAANNARGAEVAAALRSNPNAVTPPQPCTITMSTDKSDKIRSFRISGDGHCEYFEQAFARP